MLSDGSETSAATVEALLTYRHQGRFFTTGLWVLPAGTTSRGNELWTTSRGNEPAVHDRGASPALSSKDRFLPHYIILDRALTALNAKQRSVPYKYAPSHEDYNTIRVVRQSYVAYSYIKALSNKNLLTRRRM